MLERHIKVPKALKIQEVSSSLNCNIYNLLFYVYYYFLSYFECSVTLRKPRYVTKMLITYKLLKRF